MSSKVERLSERVAALDRSQPGRKRPTLMGEIEGEAWIYYCVSLLSEDERQELEQVQADINKNLENRPDAKDPEFEKSWAEYTQLLHRHGELIALGEVRAEAAAWEPWTRFEAEYRDARTQFAKVRPVESSAEGEMT
jgi:hypothetical protein